MDKRLAQIDEECLRLVKYFGLHQATEVQECFKHLKAFLHAFDSDYHKACEAIRVKCTDRGTKVNAEPFLQPAADDPNELVESIPGPQTLFGEFGNRGVKFDKESVWNNPLVQRLFLNPE